MARYPRRRSSKHTPTMSLDSISFVLLHTHTHTSVCVCVCLKEIHYCPIRHGNAYISDKAHTRSLLTLWQMHFLWKLCANPKVIILPRLASKFPHAFDYELQILLFLDLTRMQFFFEKKTWNSLERTPHRDLFSTILKIPSNDYIFPFSSNF